MEKMHFTFIAISLLVIPLWAYPSSPHPVEEIRYGAPSVDSLEVIIGGDVAKGGRYFLPKGFGLKSVLGIVAGYGWTEQRTHYDNGVGQFRGRILVSRKDASGKAQQFTFEIFELQLAKTADFELLNGDIIEICHIRLWEK